MLPRARPLPEAASVALQCVVIMVTVLPGCGSESSPLDTAAVAPASLPASEPAGTSQPAGAFRPPSPPAARDRIADRNRMVDEQIARPFDGRDAVEDAKVLQAMRAVPRHVFVPRESRDRAYGDFPLPIGHSQTISQPYIVAYMTEVLHLQGTERVLEIGTGSGYQAAVLAEIAPEVFTVEILPELLKRAQTTLGSLGYKNIHFRAADGYQGWPEFAPFDCIIVTAAPDHVPQPLIDQLKAGGRMIIPVGRFEQDLILLEKEKSGIARRTTIPVRFVPMTGKAQQNIPR